MAVKNIICQGIGFSPGTIKWIPTMGYSMAAAADAATVTPGQGHNKRRAILARSLLVGILLL